MLLDILCGHEELIVDSANVSRCTYTRAIYDILNVRALVVHDYTRNCIFPRWKYRRPWFIKIEKSFEQKKFANAERQIFVRWALWQNDQRFRDRQSGCRSTLALFLYHLINFVSILCISCRVLNTSLRICGCQICEADLIGYFNSVLYQIKINCKQCMKYVDSCDAKLIYSVGILGPFSKSQIDNVTAWLVR